MLTLAAVKKLYLHQLDVNNAFVHGELHEVVYIQAPEGYNVPPGKVLKLNKSLYGLKQTIRQWHKKLSAALLDWGFAVSSLDHSLFIKRTSCSFIALLFYVNDVIVVSDTLEFVFFVKKYLHDHFNIKELGELRYFLDMKVARSK